MMLEPGTKAPAFSLPDQNGDVHTLEEYRGKRSFCIFIRRTIPRDAQSRPVGSGSCILSLQKKTQ